MLGSLLAGSELFTVTTLEPAPLGPEFLHSDHLMILSQLASVALPWPTTSAAAALSTRLVVMVTELGHMELHVYVPVLWWVLRSTCKSLEQTLESDKCGCLEGSPRADDGSL